MATRLILLFALLSVALASQFTVPLQKSENVREKAIMEGRHKQWLAETKTQQLQSGGQGIMDFQDQYYLLEVSLGTPYQDIFVALDPTSSNFWVLDVDCTSKNCKGSTIPPKQLYNGTDSTSFIGGGPSFSLPFEGSTVSGNFAKDRLDFAGFMMSNQDFGDAKNVPAIYSQQTGAGIFGLGFPSRAVFGTKSVIKNLLPQLDSPVINVWMESLAKARGAYAGWVGFGEVDDSVCQSFTYIPLPDKTSWGFKISGVKIGTYSKQKIETAISSIGSGWTGVPAAVFSAIVKQTQAVYDWNNELYTVQCSSTLPDLTLTINGVQYPIKAENYVVNVNLPDGKCALGFFQTSTAGSAAWILGDAFARSYCHLFDYGNARLGLAQPHFHQG